MNILLQIVTDPVNSMHLVEEPGVGFICSYMREKGHKVTILGADEADVDYDGIINLNPDIIGFPVYTLSKASVHRVINKIMEKLPEVLICVGGIEPTCTGEDMMRENGNIDFTIVGEGELVFEQMVRSIEEKGTFDGIKGLIYRNGDKIIRNEGQQYIADLDQLPFTARDLYSVIQDKLIYISTIRGCRGRCTFCSSHVYHGGLRVRSPKNVADELEYLYNNFGIDFLMFIDPSFEDSIDGGVDRLHELADEIIKRNLKVSYNAFIRSDFYKKADDELMKKLKKSGHSCCSLGIEAGNISDLKLYNKKATIDDNYKILDFLRKNEIGITVNFINFNPYTTFKTLEENIDYLEKSGLAVVSDVLNTKLILYPGTPIHRKVINDPNIVLTNDLEYQFSHPGIGKLYNYLNRLFFEQDVNYHNCFNKIAYYSMIFSLFLTIGERFSSELDDYGMSEVINSIKSHRYGYMLHTSSLVAKWYRQLLNAVKADIGDEELDATFTPMFYSDEMMQMSRAMEFDISEYKRKAFEGENVELYKGYYIHIPGMELLE